MGAWGIITYIITWIVGCAGFVILAWFWWRRSKEIDSVVKNEEFPTTPVFAHLFRTIGEWFGFLVGGVGFAAVLVAFILSGFNTINFDMMDLNPIYIIFMPIIGFFIIFSARFISEQIVVLVTIARNTKK